MIIIIHKHSSIKFKRILTQCPYYESQRKKNNRGMGSRGKNVILIYTNLYLLLLKLHYTVWFPLWWDYVYAITRKKSKSQISFLPLFFPFGPHLTNDNNSGLQCNPPLELDMEFCTLMYVSITNTWHCFYVFKVYINDMLLYWHART